MARYEKECFFEQELATLNCGNEEGSTVIRAWAELLSELSSSYTLEHPDTKLRVKVHHIVDGESLKIVARFYREIGQEDHN